jgi:hypothetical protein
MFCSEAESSNISEELRYCIQLLPRYHEHHLEVHRERGREKKGREGGRKKKVEREERREREREREINRERVRDGESLRGEREWVREGGRGVNKMMRQCNRRMRCCK